jgi:hypothetical protein
MDRGLLTKGDQMADKFPHSYAISASDTKDHVTQSCDGVSVDSMAQ